MQKIKVLNNTTTLISTKENNIISDIITVQKKVVSITISLSNKAVFFISPMETIILSQIQ